MSSFLEETTSESGPTVSTDSPGNFDRFLVAKTIDIIFCFDQSHIIHKISFLSLFQRQIACGVNGIPEIVRQPAASVRG